ncbi:MAG: tetratricopeptide repeat protein [Verrucomicrobiota bacterium]
MTNRKPKKNGDSKPCVSKTLIKAVDACIEAWLGGNDLTWSHIYTPSIKALSERNTRRIRKAEDYRELIDWLNDINIIYKRLHAVAAQLKKTPPSNWPRFFGPLIPLPTAQHEPALYNNAEVKGDELNAASGPLVAWLLKEASISKDQKNVWKASSLLNQACFILELIGDYDRVAIHLAELARLNNHTDDFHFAADAFLRCGQAHLHAGNLLDAIQSFDSGLKVIEDRKGRTPPHRVRLRLLSYRAIAKLEADQPMEARRILLEEALPLAEAECSPPAIASVHNRLAIVALKLKEPDQAMQHVLAALQCRFARDMRSEVARSLVTVARVHFARNELEQAVLVWELSLSLQQALNDHESLAQTHYLLATTYALLHEKHEARSPQKLKIAVSSEWFPDASELRLLEQVAHQAPFQKIDLPTSSCRNRAISSFRSCGYLERDSDSKKFPDAPEKARLLVEARRGAG